MESLSTIVLIRKTLFLKIRLKIDISGGRRRCSTTNCKTIIFLIIQLVSDLMFVVPMLIELRHKLDGGWPTYLYLSEYFNREMYPPKIPIKGE